jgi:hypothetical protein
MFFTHLLFRPNWIPRKRTSPQCVYLQKISCSKTTIIFVSFSFSLPRHAVRTPATSQTRREKTDQKQASCFGDIWKGSEERWWMWVQVNHPETNVTKMVVRHVLLLSGTESTCQRAQVSDDLYLLTIADTPASIDRSRITCARQGNPAWHFPPALLHTI